VAHRAFTYLKYIMLLLIKLLIDCCLFILIWLVQVIIYPSFQFTSDEKLHSWHNKYQTLISYFVLPLMLLQLTISGYELIYNFNYPHLAHFLLVIAIWASTFFQAVPVHQNISNQKEVISNVLQLVQVNKLRTFLWTIVFALSFTEAYQNFII